MMLAYTITYCEPPRGHDVAFLRFTAPRRKPGFIPRDYSLSAEKQAEALARATKGFVSFARVVGAQDQWVYTTEGKQNE